MEANTHTTDPDDAYDDHNVADTGDEDPAQDPNDLDMEDKPASEDEAEPQDDGMDLFGEDEVADEVKHDEACVDCPNGRTQPSLNWYPKLHCSAPSRESSEHLDGISSSERKHREAMEYAEEDEPEQTMEEAKLEAHANIPNIPVPRSSDGNVSPLVDSSSDGHRMPLCVATVFINPFSALGYSYTKFSQGGDQTVPPRYVCWTGARGRGRRRFPTREKRD